MMSRADTSPLPSVDAKCRYSEAFAQGLTIHCIPNALAQKGKSRLAAALGHAGRISHSRPSASLSASGVTEKAPKPLQSYTSPNRFTKKSDIDLLQPIAPVIGRDGS